LNCIPESLLNTNIHLTSDQIKSIDESTSNKLNSHIISQWPNTNTISNNTNNKDVTEGNEYGYENTSPSADQTDLHKMEKSASLPSIKRRLSIKNINSNKDRNNKNEREKIIKKNKLFKLSVPHHKRDLNNLVDIDTVNLNNGGSLDFTSAIH